MAASYLCGKHNRKYMYKFLIATIAICLFSCTGRENVQYTKAENAFDAGREFIDGCLKGDFKKAAFFMLKNTINNQQLDKLAKDYISKTKTDKEEYRQASIIIGDEETLNDSTHIIHYRNSFDKIARKVKVIKQNDSWLVDLAYTFDGNL